MSLKSSPSRYGAVAITIHWVTALAILAMLISGLAASNATDPATEATILRAHAIMGICVGVLTLLRILWWLIIDKRPAAASMPRWQAIASKAVHYGLYAVILVMVSSGLATLLLTGANQQIFGAAALPLPDFSMAPPYTAHGILARLLILLLIGHIGAALYHQFIRRDRLLARMGLGSP